jgi:kynurenine formamidase
MLLTFTDAGRTYRFNAARPIEISIPLQFGGPQPHTYGVPPATAQAYEQDGWVGDVRRGGSCNFERYTLVPHCNGTHTECVGHITAERVAVTQVLRETLVPGRLVTVRTEPAGVPDETTDPAPKPADRLITRRALQAAWGQAFLQNEQALVIRTLPNTEEKLAADYGAFVPPYFTREAMEWVVAQRFTHLLVDVPSVDRLLDEGKLSTHRIFWQLPAGNSLAHAHRTEATITEFIFVPPAVADGLYVVQLQIPPFVADAAPSRIFLYELA